MTENDRIALVNFEQKLHLLLHNYTQLQERNNELERIVEEKENLLREMQMRCLALENNYNNLKQAKVISLSYSDTEAAKAQLSKLVREIDQCIESLKK